MGISKELLEILVCPKCKGELRLNQTQDGLICERCRLLYEIREDIPIMLIDEAKKLDAYGMTAAGIASADLRVTIGTVVGPVMRAAGLPACSRVCGPRPSEA